MKYITLTQDSIATEHICCAFSDKKCAESYQLKKQWLREEFKNGYVFERINERAKVFMEYGPAEMSWVPVTAPNYLMLGCFWVSGKYKKQGHGKALLRQAITLAKSRGMDGLVTVVGSKKFHFMSDLKWFLRQGFEIRETTPAGFSLISLDFEEMEAGPHFKDCVLGGGCAKKSGVVVYYSNRCPYSEFHVKNSLVESCEKRNLELTVIKLESREEAQLAPTPATIFSLFLNGDFVTTNIGGCMDSRFDKVVLGGS